MCQRTTLPDGTVAIICGSKHGRRLNSTPVCARCKSVAVALCDSEIDPLQPHRDDDAKPGQRARCSVPMCAQHVYRGEDGKDYCWHHREQAAEQKPVTTKRVKK